MGALSKILRSAEAGRLMFWGARCDDAHQAGVGDGPGPRWGYNGNPDAPTFTPSIYANAPGPVRPDTAPVFLPPLAPEIREPAALPIASRNPQIIANRAIDAYGVCTIKRVGTVAAYDQAAVELGKARER